MGISRPWWWLRYKEPSSHLIGAMESIFTSISKMSKKLIMLKWAYSCLAEIISGRLLQFTAVYIHVTTMRHWCVEWCGPLTHCWNTYICTGGMPYISKSQLITWSDLVSAIHNSSQHHPVLVTLVTAETSGSKVAQSYDKSWTGVEWQPLSIGKMLKMVVFVFVACTIPQHPFCNGHYNCTPDLGKWWCSEDSWLSIGQLILDAKVLDWWCH